MEFVARDHHRQALRKQKGNEKIAHLLLAKSIDALIIRGAFGAAVPRAVVGGAVLVILTVGVVVFVVVADQVVEREAIVSGDEIHGGPGFAPRAIEDVAGSAQAFHEFTYGGVAFPEIAHGVAKFVVPLTPARRKFSDLVATWTTIPGLSDFFDVLQVGILAANFQETALLIKALRLT